jgi:hypothetical protein
MKRILLITLVLFSFSFTSLNDLMDEKRRHGSVSQCFSSNYEAYTWTWNNFHAIANAGGYNIVTTTQTLIPGIVCVFIDYDYYSILPLKWNPDTKQFEPEQ